MRAAQCIIVYLEISLVTLWSTQLQKIFMLVQIGSIHEQSNDVAGYLT